MTQEKDQGPIRLVSLSSAGDGEEGHEISQRLLALCIEKSVQGFVRVPPGHAAVVYENVVSRTERALFGPARTAIMHKNGPVINREVRYLGLDTADLREIQNSGEAAVEAFINGGYASWNAGLMPLPIKYSVIQKDRPNPFDPDRGRFPERTLEGLVHPVVQSVRLKDVLVGDEDASALREYLKLEVPDKWGHKISAPSVFLVYQQSQRDYDPEAIRDELLKDESGVFIKAGAEAVARIIKRDVRENAEAGLAVAKITNNEVGKDYSDPTLSKRMSLFLLATDCWVHDRSLLNQLNERMRPRREEIEIARQSAMALSDFNKLVEDLRESELAERNALKPHLYMPAGLNSYLLQLGFGENLASHLARIITGSKTDGRHASTERLAAARGKGVKTPKK